MKDDKDGFKTAALSLDERDAICGIGEVFDLHATAYQRAVYRRCDGVHASRITSQKEFGLLLQFLHHTRRGRAAPRIRLARSHEQVVGSQAGPILCRCLELLVVLAVSSIAPLFLNLPQLESPAMQPLTSKVSG